LLTFLVGVSLDQCNIHNKQMYAYAYTMAFRPTSNDWTWSFVAGASLEPGQVGVYNNNRIDYCLTIGC